MSIDIETEHSDLKKQEKALNIVPSPNQVLLGGVIQSELEEMYRSWQSSQTPRSGLHASSILSASDAYCHREHVLGTRYQRLQPIHNAHTLAIFLNGWRLHEKWQALFQLAGVAVEVETSHVDPRWSLRFTPDAIIDLRGNRYIVEIKGYRQETCLKIDQANPWRNAEYRKAHIQANLYMYMLQIPKAIVLIENKNTQQFYTWVIDYDETLAAPYIKRMNTLNDLTHAFHTSGKLVSRLPECQSKDSPRAKKCPLRDACFASKEERAAMEVGTNG